MENVIGTVVITTEEYRKLIEDATRLADIRHDVTYITMKNLMSNYSYHSIDNEAICRICGVDYLELKEQADKFKAENNEENDGE